MKLIARIKKIQDELSSLKDQCRELLTAKQVKKLNPFEINAERAVF